MAGVGWFFLSATVIEALPQTPWTTIAVLVADVAVVVTLARRLDIPVAATVGVASAVAVDWYSIPPTHRDLMPDPGNTLALASYLVMGSLLGELAVRARQRAVTAEGARVELEGKQAALRRVATLVAHETPPEEVFALVTEEVGRILGVDLATMVRFEPDGTATVMAVWSESRPWLRVGTRLEPDGESVATLVRDTGASAAVENYDQVRGSLATTLRQHGVRASIGSPILVSGLTWGAMIAASRTGNLPAAGRAELNEFTELVASAVANAHARTELTASRRRIVAAADLARRQIERDLHDGVQQRLVSMALGMRLVGDMVGDGDDPTASLSALTEELLGTMEELRELSHGIHPAILAEGGLRPAVTALARRCPMPVELDVRGSTDRVPEAVEVGVYYVVSESLNNVVKHAGAESVRVELDLAPDQVELVVTDDGHGGADLGRGTGLVGLADRIHALGGEFELASPRGAGTTLRARVPWQRDSASPAGDRPDRLS